METKIKKSEDPYYLTLLIASLIATIRLKTSPEIAASILKDSYGLTERVMKCMKGASGE